jgi:hypothetical protein
MFPERENFKSTDNFIKESLLALEKKIQEDFPVIQLKLIAKSQENLTGSYKVYYILKIQESFMISLKETDTKTGECLFLLQTVGIHTKSIGLGFSDLNKLYRTLFIFLKDPVIIKHLPVLTCSLNSAYFNDIHSVYFGINPFDSDI